MTNASKKTYLEQLYTGNLENNTVNILDYIYKEGPKSTKELRDELIYPHQSLTGCLSNLMDEGLIKIVGTVTNEVNGRKSTFSVFEFVSNETEQTSLKNERHLEKANNWLKGYDKYKGILKISLIEY